MQKEYGVKVYRILLNLFWGLAGAGLVFFVLNGWLLSTMNSFLVAVAIYLLYIWLVIFNNMMKVIVTGKELIIKKGSKTQTFDIETSGFKAIENSSGGETSCELVVTEANGNQSYIDFELIGVKQFESLLDDLGFNGDRDEVQKVETKKKDI